MSLDYERRGYNFSVLTMPEGNEVPGVTPPLHPGGWAMVGSGVYHFLKAIGELVSRVGLSITVVIVLWFMMYLMGTAKTHDDFAREVAFGSVTGTRYAGIFFVLLVLIGVLGIDTRIRDTSAQSAELKRVIKERDMWQEKALQMDLSHTPER